MAIPPERFPFPTRSPFPRLLIHLRLLLHLQRTSPSKDGHHGWCDLPSPGRTVHGLDHSLSLPLEIDLSQVNNPGTPPELLVDAVHRLGPFLECELLGEGDLKIVGPQPIDAGGSADVWAGEMDGVTRVAIKSFRHYSSSSPLSAYFVSVECCHDVFYLLKFTLEVVQGSTDMHSPQRQR